MPELPDLTVFAANLAKAVTGKRISRVEYRSNKPAVSPKELSDSLVSAEIKGVERVGKQICFSISNGNTVFIHLMLNGGFLLTSCEEVKNLDYLVLGICFADGSAMAVTDPKAWAKVALNPKPDTAPDALSITEDQLKAMFQKKPKMLAKALLLDQQLIGGIGNAYSDEILWKARISPKSRVGKLPAEAIKALAEAIPAVLKEATEYLKKHHPDMVAGEFREFLKVHNPSLRQSPGGSKIIKEQIASKRTYYTEEQQLYV